MRITIFILLLIAFITSDAQTHAEEYYEYDHGYKTMLGYYNRGLYHKAALYPDSLEGNRFVDASSNYFCARVYALSNEFDKTLSYLEKAVKQGITKNQIEKMYDLDGFRESNMSIIFNLNYDKWHQEYLEYEQSIVLDSIYINQLKGIREKSNKIWDKVKYDEKGNFSNRNDSTVLYLAIQQKDTLFTNIVDLTLKKGFPTKKIIGKEFYSYSRILRYNMPENYDENCEDWRKIKKLIFVEINKGTVYPFYYAAIEDNICVSRKQPQIYGTIPIVYSGNKDVSDVLEYENPEELNIRRRAVGLCSIQLELWSKARELPLSLKEIEFK